jgi:ABC-type sugar transport system ATPase subunit
MSFWARNRRKRFDQLEQALRRHARYLAKYRLDVSPQAIVKHLGVGKMQMVEIAKALSENAKILILDEPTSALTESEIDKLMEILENLRSHGVTCIYITHKLTNFSASPILSRFCATARR